MTKKIKAALSLLLAFAMLMSVTSITAFATSTNDDNAELTPTSGISTMAYNVTLNGSYTVVASGAKVKGKSITIVCYNAYSNQHNDVRMKDAAGNVLWEEYGAIDYSSQRTFHCGNDVQSVEVRIGGKDIIGDLFTPKVGSCNVIF